MNHDKGEPKTKSAIIHVLIMGLTGVVAEIVAQKVQQQPDLELLGNFEEWERVAAAIAKADVLVLGDDNIYSPPAVVLRLLSDHPNLKILALKTSSDEAIAYWGALHCHQMEIISSQTLIESIRQIHSLSPF